MQLALPSENARGLVAESDMRVGGLSQTDHRDPAQPRNLRCAGSVFSDLDEKICFVDSDATLEGKGGHVCASPGGQFRATGSQKWHRSAPKWTRKARSEQ